MEVAYATDNKNARRTDAKIEYIAKEMGLKKSDVTRMAIKEFIEEYIGEEKKIKPYTRIKHLLGIAESGVADLGQSHREHLIKKLKANINERNSGYRPWVALIDRSESMHDRFLRN